MQLNLRNMWGIFCFLGIAVHAAKDVDLISQPRKNKYVAGCTVENINPAGFQMCRKLCKKRTDCCGINFNVEHLTCSLLSSPCSENDANVESKEGYIYDFVQKDENRTQTKREKCQFSKCFSSAAGPDICLNYAKPRDCNDIQTVETGNPQVCAICPYPAEDRPEYIVQCNFYNGSQWTVIQKRFDGSQDFYKNWNEYKQGFGTATGEYWIGNQALFELTSTARYELMVLITDFDGNQYYARYSHFSVGNEISNFLLTVGGYNGNAGDGLNYHNGMQFSTYDHNNDVQSSNFQPCANYYRAGWWYKNCVLVDLNGIYYSVETITPKCMHWSVLKEESLKSSTMMIRRY